MARPFHIALHALVDRELAESESELDGKPVRVLELPATALTHPLPISFEDAVERLSALPRMFVEPDGSFVWVSNSADSAWQLDGVLFDRGGSLQYVELHGTCSKESFESLTGIFGNNEMRFVIQLMQQAIFLCEAEFCRIMWG
jgi:hypothetical protein